MIYEKNTVCLPRQGIPFCLRPLYLLDFRGIRAEIWDTFGTVEDRDMAQNSRCRLQMEELHRLFCTGGNVLPIIILTCALD